MDVAIIDVPWNGFSQSVQIGRLAEACQTNIAPHNSYRHLADLHSLDLCAVLPNVRIMEINIDDMPWKGARRIILAPRGLNNLMQYGETNQLPHAGRNFQKQFAPTRMRATLACYKTAAHEKCPSDIIRGMSDIT